MVRKAENYAWSSVAGHCGLRTAALLNESSAWLKQYEGDGEWSAWLAEGEQPEQLDILRRHVEKGLPCGAERFVRNWSDSRAGHCATERRDDRGNLKGKLGKRSGSFAFLFFLRKNQAPSRFSRFGFHGFQDTHAPGFACTRATALTGATARVVPGGLIRKTKAVLQRG